MDEKLVSNALDIAQLFFNYSELRNQLQIVEWNRTIELEKLKDSPQHRLLGETIEMFLHQDQEAFNFDQLDRLYFLVYGNQVIGSTSPITLFMASPNAQEGLCDIPVEQNVQLFSLWRPLYMRSERFVKYIYALFTAYPELKRRCGEVNSYLIANLPLLPTALQNDILKEIGNPAAMDLANADRARAFLEINFMQMEEGVQALGVPFYGARPEDVQAAIAASDFRMKPSRPVDGIVPLVLQNHLNATQTDTFTYITGTWDDNTVIRPEDYSVEPKSASYQPPRISIRG